MKRKHIFPLILFLLFLSLFSVSASAYGPSDLTIPSSAEAIVYGQSGAGRDLTAYRFGTGKNVMVLGFALHGWEDNFDQDGGALVWAAGQLMQQLHSNLDVLDAYNWSVYVLPCMNPDGLLDGYSHNGPGRHTTTSMTSSGSLSSTGVDLNRCFPYNWISYGSGRNYNGSAPLAAKEARALASFIQNVKGSGTNILIDTHGWTQQIITLSRSSALYTTFSQAFPSNTYANLTAGRGYFAAYAYSLGYNACLFEFPSNVSSLRGFQSSGYSSKYSGCILSLLKSTGSYTSYTVSAVAQGSGTVTGSGTYARGATAVLTATPASGAEFLGWYDRNDSLLSRALTYRFPVSYNTTVYARFENPCNLTISVTGSGTVSGAGTYAAGTSVTLTAAPASGWCFQGWYNAAGEALSTDSSCTLTLRQDTALTAVFAPVISARASRSGTVSGTGTYALGTTAELIAVSNAPDRAFQGWYLPDGTLLSTDAAYTVAVISPLSLIAMFEGDYFYDVPSGSWYEPYAAACGARGLVNGTSPFCFSPSGTMTRAMVVAILARMDGSDLSAAPECPFVDVSQSQYYAPALNWAYENGVISGVDATHFRPSAPVTREQFMAILIRYLENCRGITLEPANPVFTDTASISAYALSAVSKALTIEVEFGGSTVNLITGYEDGTFRPKGKLTRAEGVAFLTRLCVYLETPAPEAPDSQAEGADEAPIDTPDEAPDEAPIEVPDEAPVDALPGEAPEDGVDFEKND